ncbi:MAG: sodium:solute symporter family transporter, partial [Bacteroidia bacterium]
YLNFSSPIVFNQKQIDKTLASEHKAEFQENQKAYEILNQKKQVQVKELSASLKSMDKVKIDKTTLELQTTETQAQGLRVKAKETIVKADKLADTNDTNYIFLYFVVHHLPIGLIGLLIAVIFLSAWGSIAAALNSLASTTVIDIYKRLGKEEKTELHYYKSSKWITLFWGLFCIGVAMFASKLGSLIEAVNILGSLFYGTILGIFMVAFYMKSIRGNAAFWAAVVTEILVIAIYVADIISFLWLNVIGCLLVMGIAFVYHKLFSRLHP